MKNKPKFFKILFFLSAGYTIFFFFVWFVLNFFEKPRLHRYTSYESIYNWNLPIHPRGDYDKDGKQDLISFSGCAFLSRVTPDQIPVNSRCIATGISGFVGDTINKGQIGQKYTITDTYDLDLGFFAKGIDHSYLEMQRDGNWYIVIHDTAGLRRYMIDDDGVLKEVPTGTFYTIDELLYRVSSWFTFLALPTALVFYVLPPFLGSVSGTYPAFPLFVFIGITFLWYVMWSKSSRTKQ